MNHKLIEILEHQELSDEQKEYLVDIDILLPNNNNSPNFLGLSASGNVGYYIGAKWLKENEVAIVINPKIKYLDYLKMFMHCFNNPITSNFISKIYNIDFERAPIKIPSTNFELTPLIIIHFLNLVKKIVKKGLKRDYIWVENNLNSKIKGKIIINQNIKQNITKSRPDKTYCKYQEYSQNCIENRLIKRTLDFVFSYLKYHYSKNKDLFNLFYYNYIAFSNISEKVDINDLKRIKINSFYKEYNETLKIAKVILKRFDYSIQNIKKRIEKYPPFHIDMSLLFELYVYSKLYKTYGQDIIFQYKGKGEYLDFLNIKDKTIIDTKYKEIYNKGKYKIEDIRQLSGYSRDINVLKKLNLILDENTPILDCVIIYPNQNSNKVDIDNLNFKAEKISQFHKFYKYGIKLPEKQRNTNTAISNKEQKINV